VEMSRQARSPGFLLGCSGMCSGVCPSGKNEYAVIAKTAAATGRLATWQHAVLMLKRLLQLQLELS